MGVFVVGQSPTGKSDPVGWARHLRNAIMSGNSNALLLDSVARANGARAIFHLTGEKGEKLHEKSAFPHNCRPDDNCIPF